MVHKKRYLSKNTYLVKIPNYEYNGYTFLLGKNNNEREIWDTRKTRVEELIAAISWYMNELDDVSVKTNFNLMATRPSRRPIILEKWNVATKSYGISPPKNT